MRDEVDLKMICDRLVSVVDKTLQPEMMTLWLRESSLQYSDAPMKAGKR